MTHETKCHRCNGTGYIEYHSNILGGICFNCWGKGKTTRSASPKRKKNTIENKRFFIKKNGKYQVIDRKTSEIKATFSAFGDAIKLVKELNS